MTTLRKWFSWFTETTGEEPAFIIFGKGGDWGRSLDEWPTMPEGVEPWPIADAILDCDFDPGYGGNNSPDLCAWSPSWVIFSDNYDGAESLCWVPRNPVPHDPIRPGGG